MSNYKLLASDVDGTLLNSSGVLSIENQEAVKRMVAKGYYFVLSTGRPLQAVKDLVEKLNLQNMPLILYNGAMVILSGEVIFNLTLNTELVEIIAREAHKRNSIFICWADNKLYTEKDCEKVRQYKKVSGVEPIVVEDITNVNNITKFVWLDSCEQTAINYEELKKLYGDIINIHPSRIDFLEFVNKDCSKSVAMGLICKILNIDVSETIAVGDGVNDIEMVKFAALGIAVDNADSRLKIVSDEIVASCDENGVNQLIDRFFK